MPASAHNSLAQVTSQFVPATTKRIIIIIIVIIIIIIIIYFFKIDFYITFYNYKKPIDVNLPRNLEKNLDAKRFPNSLI